MQILKRGKIRKVEKMIKNGILSRSINEIESEVVYLPKEVECSKMEHTYICFHFRKQLVDANFAPTKDFHMVCYLFPFNLLCVRQSIWQLEMSVAPPFDQAVT